MKCSVGHPLVKIRNRGKRFNAFAGAMVYVEVRRNHCSICGARIVRNPCERTALDGIQIDSTERCEFAYDGWHVALAEKIHWLDAWPHPVSYRKELLAEIKAHAKKRRSNWTPKLRPSLWPRID